MISDFFGAVIYDPLYNGLIFLINTIPYADVGIAVILLTIATKLILFPLSIKAVRTQMLVKEIEEPLKKIKEEFKDDREKQAKETMALYKEKGINPFSSFLTLFIQLPIIFALYWIFFKGGLPEINVDILYSFISIPEIVNMNFLGIVDMGGKNMLLALGAGVTQFFQAKLSLPPMKPRSEGSSMKDDFARSFHIQMRYILPIIIVFIAYAISAAVALYWVTSNIFAIGQELYVRKNIKEKYEAGRD